MKADWLALNMPAPPPCPGLSAQAQETYERAWKEDYRRDPSLWNLYIHQNYAEYGLLEVLENEMQRVFAHIIQHHSMRCWHHLDGLCQFMMDSCNWTGRCRLSTEQDPPCKRSADCEPGADSQFAVKNTYAPQFETQTSTLTSICACLQLLHGPP